MNTNANPYQSPNTAQSEVDKHELSPIRSRMAARYQFLVWLIAYFYPVWLLTSFYVTWLIAWLQLGRRPRPSLDDPKSIGGILDIAYYVPGILLILLPVLTPIGLAASFYCPIDSRRNKRRSIGFALAVFYALLCIVALYILRSDPARVVEWWFD